MDSATDIVSRIFIAIFGIAWFFLASLNIELGQRELTFSFREWAYFAMSIAGVLLVVLSCLPSRLLSSGVVKWGYLPVILFVEFGIVLTIHRNLYHLDRGFVALVAAVLGVLIALAAAKMLWRRG